LGGGGKSSQISRATPSARPGPRHHRRRSAARRRRRDRGLREARMSRSRIGGRLIFGAAATLGPGRPASSLGRLGLPPRPGCSARFPRADPEQRHGSRALTAAHSSFGRRRQDHPRLGDCRVYRKKWPARLGPLTSDHVAAGRRRKPNLLNPLGRRRHARKLGKIDYCRRRTAKPAEPYVNCKHRRLARKLLFGGRGLTNMLRIRYARRRSHGNDSAASTGPARTDVDGGAAIVIDILRGGPIRASRHRSGAVDASFQFRGGHRHDGEKLGMVSLLGPHALSQAGYDLENWGPGGHGWAIRVVSQDTSRPRWIFCA